ncbi:hypothetical protein D3C84_683680 [compost metagenome]
MAQWVGISKSGSRAARSRSRFWTRGARVWIAVVAMGPSISVRCVQPFIPPTRSATRFLNPGPMLMPTNAA